MTKNEKFNEALERSGMTMYALAKRSGVPYTTVNEIHKGKNDINQCAAGTVWRLAAALGEPPDSIINPINYLDGVKGRYKGIDYTWMVNGSTYVTFEYEGEPVMLDAGATLNIPSRMDYYSIIAGWMIKEYIESREWQKSVQNRVKGMAAI